MDDNLLSVCEALKASRPPYTTELLHDVACIDWNLVRDDEIEICLDIIDRTMAAIIICSFDIYGTERENYKKSLIKLQIT